MVYFGTGKVVTNARKTIVKMSKHYIYAEKWRHLTQKHL